MKTHHTAAGPAICGAFALFTTDGLTVAYRAGLIRCVGQDPAGLKTVLELADGTDRYVDQSVEEALTRIAVAEATDRANQRGPGA